MQVVFEGRGVGALIGGGVSSQYPRKRSLFTVVPMPQSSMRSCNVLVLFSANDMPKLWASELREAQVVLARDSTVEREVAEMHMSTSSTYEITNRLWSGETIRRGSMSVLIYAPKRKGDRGDP